MVNKTEGAASQQINVHVSNQEKAGLEQLAKREQRTLSNLVRTMIRDRLEIERLPQGDAAGGLEVRPGNFEIN